jgi:peptidoglycan L-alanyl-D-glutamate endopeptidase CwlK
MSTKLEDLRPDAQARAVQALAELKKKSIQAVVTYTYRIRLEQYALWCQGRQPLAETNAARLAATLAGANMPPIIEYMGRDKKTHSDNDNIVTNCNGTKISEGGTGESAHQKRTALDVVPDLDLSEKERPGWPVASDPRWEEIAIVFEEWGFEWGGRWTKEKDGIDPDYPHYQLRA